MPPPQPNARPRSLSITIVAALMIALTLPVCSSDKTIATTIPLPDGASDAFGVLPAEVGGWKVTRGAAAGYVPDQSCKECHEPLFESYQSVGMARSFYQLTPATAVEDFGKTFFQEETRYYYEMNERDGKYYQKRYCKDEFGTKFAEHEVEVAWVVGSGNHARTYVSQTDHGELFQMPLSWYTGKGWGMSPGFESARHDRFERQIQRACMFCHNAYPEVPVGSDLPGSPHVFPHDMPEGIGCQRCHGPGARHVEAAADPDGREKEILDRIVNPANFTPRQSEELCMTCHTQPDVSSGGESTSRAFDRPEYAHRPGQSIMDYITYFDFGSAEDRASKIEVNHHGHRMRKSLCYTASEGKLSCMSCHDPHRKIKASERTSFYRDRCLRCHQLDDCQMEGMGTTHDPAKADCVSCHMLEARPRDVVQVTITDHLIRRKAPPGGLTSPHQPAASPLARLETIPVFPSRGPKGALLDLHTGLAKKLRLQRDEVPAVLTALRALPQKYPSAFVRVSGAISSIGDYASAVEVLREGLRLFPTDYHLRWNLAMELYRLGEHDDALTHVDTSLAAKRIPRALELRGNLLIQKGKLEPALEAFEESLKIRPVHADSWRRYAHVLKSLGRSDEAIRAFRQALARNPDEPEVYRQLFRLYVAQGKPKDALHILRQGGSRLFELRLERIVQRATGNPILRDSATALRLARELIQKMPSNPRAHLHLALVQTIAGNDQDAASAVEKARSLSADPASCTGLTLLHELSRPKSTKVAKLVERLAKEQRDPGTETLRETILRIVKANLERRGR